jgi:hypothetical protein
VLQFPEGLDLITLLRNLNGLRSGPAHVKGKRLSARRRAFALESKGLPAAFAAMLAEATFLLTGLAAYVQARQQAAAQTTENPSRQGSAPGKGSVIWSAVSGLREAVKYGVVRLHGIDPKRIELAMGRGVFSSYAADPDGKLAILRDAVERLRARTAMSGRSRKLEPSADMPLQVNHH